MRDNHRDTETPERDNSSRLRRDIAAACLGLAGLASAITGVVILGIGMLAFLLGTAAMCGAIFLGMGERPEPEGAAVYGDADPDDDGRMEIVRERGSDTT